MRNWFAPLFFTICIVNPRPSGVCAQSATHIMVTADQLAWSAMPTLPPGAQVAIIEGPLNEPVPFTIRLRLPFAYLMTSAFVSLSLATWALVVGLHRDLQSAGLHRAGLWFLAVWGAGLLVAATFPIDLDDAPQTLAGRIHATNGPIIFLSLTVATNLVSRGFKHDVRWHPIHRFTSVLALLMIPEFGLARARGTGAGIVQRAFIVTLATWFLVVATQLRSYAIRDATRTS